MLSTDLTWRCARCVFNIRFWYVFLQGPTIIIYRNHLLLDSWTDSSCTHCSSGFLVQRQVLGQLQSVFSVGFSTATMVITTEHELKKKMLTLTSLPHPSGKPLFASFSTKLQTLLTFIKVENSAVLGKNKGVENGENHGSYFLLVPGQNAPFTGRVFSFVI